MKSSCTCEYLRSLLRIKGECQPNFWFYEISSCWFYWMLFRINVGKLLLAKWMHGNPRTLHFGSKINSGVHHQITSPYEMQGPCQAQCEVLTWVTKGLESRSFVSSRRGLWAPRVSWGMGAVHSMCGGAFKKGEFPGCFWGGSGGFISWSASWVLLKGWWDFRMRRYVKEV